MADDLTMLERIACAIAATRYEDGWTEQHFRKMLALWRAAGSPRGTFGDDYGGIGVAMRQAEAVLAVLREPSAEMVAAALPVTAEDGEFTSEQKRIGAGAVMLLSGGRRIPKEGDAVIQAAQLVRDYQTMIDAIGGGG